MAKQARKSAAGKGKSAPAGATVSVWEDDPEPAVLVTRPIPNLGKKPLAFAFSGAAPAAGMYTPGTAQFRYWTAAEALRRGADFWASVVPGLKWEVGAVLKVILDEGEDLNAYYDRKALNFFHGPGQGGVVYSGESPDVVCHEMGHAILDSIKPQLWNAASHETAAFHESFADMSAILSALQLPSLRSAIVNDTQGHLYRNSRLSRLAEQLGSAIRLQSPDAVDPDCLRNAVNSFTYQDPINLPQGAPAAHLSSEAHSFSRLFTGAFFEILAGMLAAKGSDLTKLPDLLSTVAGEIGGILVAGVRQAPVVPNWYAQVAAAMVQASGTVNAAYPPIFRAVFVRRSILSLHSAANVEVLQRSIAAVAGKSVAARKSQTARADEPLVSVAISAGEYGLAVPLLVEAASHPRQFTATAAATAGNGFLEPAGSSTAARAFVDDLFTRGRVDYGDIATTQHFNHGRRLRSHKLVADDGAIRLQRCLFDCGFAH